MIYNSEQAREVAAKRKNPGRNPGKVRADLIKAMDGIWPLEEALAALKTSSQSNRPQERIEAISLWLAYRLGKPIERKEITGEDGGSLVVKTVIVHDTEPLGD
ncbi:MAG: hypothetical protein ABFD97_20245 [Syntrophobacter sp.]